MKKLPWILVGILSVALMFTIKHNAQLMDYHNTYTDTLTVQDTVPFPFPVPVPKDSIVLRYKYISIPVPSDSSSNTSEDQPNIIESTSDSILISLPIIQRKYETKLFTAWVSGYDPRLDSCLVYPETTTIIQKAKQPTWTIDTQAGLEVFNGVVYPYVHLGIFTRTKSQWNVGGYVGVKLDVNHLKPSLNLTVKRTIFSW